MSPKSDCNKPCQAMNPILYDQIKDCILKDALSENFFRFLELEDEYEPNFVSETLNIYFHDAEERLRNLNNLLQLFTNKEEMDQTEILIEHFALRGASSYIGAKRVIHLCDQFLVNVKANDIEMSHLALEQIERAYYTLKVELQKILQLHQEIYHKDG